MKLLDRLYIFMVLICRVIAEHVHVEPDTFLDECQSDSPSSNDRVSFAGDLIAQKWQIGMPESPLVLSRQMLGGPHFSGKRTHHEEGKLRGRLREHIRGVRER